MTQVSVGERETNSYAKAHAVTVASRSALEPSRAVPVGEGARIPGLDVVEFFSDVNRRRCAVWTWTPPTPGPHPLLLLLHGAFDAGGHGWWLRAQAHHTAARLVQEGVPAPVLLMPADTGVEEGSAWADWADGSAAAETFLIDELLGWAQRELPVDGRRWVTGLSMGGYGAISLALRHPETFTSATSMSGFFRPQRLLSLLPALEGRVWPTAAALDQGDILSRIEHEPPQRLRIAFDCGLQDEMLNDNREAHSRLTELGIPHGYLETTGAHTWEYWRARLPDHIRYHSGRDDAFTPVV